MITDRIPPSWGAGRRPFRLRRGLIALAILGATTAGSAGGVVLLNATSQDSSTTACLHGQGAFGSYGPVSSSGTVATGPSCDPGPQLTGAAGQGETVVIPAALADTTSPSPGS